MRFAATLLCALAIAVLSPSLGGQETASNEKKPAAAAPETVIGGLNRPAGIALQPETGVVFVTESGAGRVSRVVDGKLEPILQGAPVGGPLGLEFVDKQTLIVGDGGRDAGKDQIRVFKLPDDGAKVLEYESAAETRLGPVPGGDAQPAVHGFIGLALARHGLYAIGGGKSKSGWVLKSDLKGTKFGDLERTIQTAGEAGPAVPTAITLSSRGEVVVALATGGDNPSKSQLAFYSAKTNQPLLQLDTGLGEISAIAYSPKTGLLYATDAGRNDTGNSGLYRLDSDVSAGEQKIKPMKIAELQRPTAIAFDKEGTAYIAIEGASEASDKPTGAVMKLSGL